MTSSSSSTVKYRRITTTIDTKILKTEMLKLYQNQRQYRDRLRIAIILLTETEGNIRIAVIAFTKNCEHGSVTYL